MANPSLQFPLPPLLPYQMSFKGESAKAHFKTSAVPEGFDVRMEKLHYALLMFFNFLACVSDYSRCAETVFPAGQELDSGFSEARTRNRHAAALPCHGSETGTETHRSAGTQ